VGGHLPAGRDLELDVDPVQVAVDGLRGDLERRRDLLVALPLAEAEGQLRLLGTQGVLDLGEAQETVHPVLDHGGEVNHLGARAISCPVV
jgi:hypothetical protein